MYAALAPSLVAKSHISKTSSVCSLAVRIIVGAADNPSNIFDIMLS